MISWSINPGIAIIEPRDDSPRPLVGNALVLWRCRADSFGCAEDEALLGDIDCFRRRVGFEDVDFSSEADDGSEGEDCCGLTVDWDVFFGNDW